jgi:acyl-CoA thioester hydrolase
MPDVFDYPHTVTTDEIDGIGHANNVFYIAWMQDAAVAHSVAQGWPGERYRQIGQGWVVRSHSIEYLAPAQAGDELIVRTWVSEMRRVSSRRRYDILRASDQILLAQAETVWAYVDLATLRPTRIPPELVADFVVVTRESAGVPASAGGKAEPKSG